MASTSSDFIFGFASFTSSGYFSQVNRGNALKKKRMFATPVPGRGSRKTKISARDGSNFLLAQASPQISESGEVVTKLRAMQYLGATPAYFGEGTAGEVFDRIIENVAAAHDRKQTAFIDNTLVLPNDITLCITPYRLVFIWRKINGSIALANTYAHKDDVSDEGIYIKTVTHINPTLVEFVAQHVSETGPKQTGAVLAGTTPDVRQSTVHDHELDGSDTHTPNLRRGRVDINSTTTPRRRKNG